MPEMTETEHTRQILNRVCNRLERAGYEATASVSIDLAYEQTVRGVLAWAPARRLAWLDETHSRVVHAETILDAAKEINRFADEIPDLALARRRALFVQQAMLTTTLENAQANPDAVALLKEALTKLAVDRVRPR